MARHLKPKEVSTVKKIMQNKYSVYIPKSVRKSFLKIPSPWVDRIKKVIDILEINPYLGEKMHGELSDRRKIRIWPYRIIYRINEKKSIIEIFEIKHRGNVSYD